jgi:hypothetical protein
MSSANIHDFRLYVPIIQGIKLKLDASRPITRPERINADKAYDSREGQLGSLKRNTLEEM